MERGVTAEGGSAALPVWLRRVGIKVVKEATMNRRRERPALVSNGAWGKRTIVFSSLSAIPIHMPEASLGRQGGSIEVNPRQARPLSSAISGTYLRLEGRRRIKL